MRKLINADLANIVGITLAGYRVEDVRVKQGPFTDSDHYGIIFGKNDSGHYVTWQFHLDEDEKINPYWGHYFREDQEAALRDFAVRE